MASTENSKDAGATEEPSKAVVTSKDRMDALIAVLQLIVSWPFALLIVLILIHDQIPGMAERIQSIGPSGIELREQVRQEIATQVAPTLETLERELAEIRQEARCQQAFQPVGTDSTSQQTPEAPVVLPPEQLDALRQELTNVANYLAAVGFSEEARDSDIGVMTNFRGSFVDKHQRLICIGVEALGDPSFALREYTYIALYWMKPPPSDWSEWSPTSGNVASGLAYYYPARSTKTPTVAGQSLDNSQVIDTGTPRPSPGSEPLEHIEQGRPWGGAFWKMQQVVGPERADHALFAAWAGLTKNDLENLSPADFVQRVISELARDGGEDVTEQVRELFARRGVTVPE